MDKTFKIGLLRETKTPPDKRVAIPPAQAKELKEMYPQVDIVAQPSELRCYADSEYVEAGIPLQEDVSDCDLLIGVKEVKIEALLPGKSYLFFAHVAKKQPHNRKLIQAIAQKGITLLDHEYLTNPKGERLVAFGHWAGVVGAYNGLIAYGKRTGQFELPRAKDCHDYQELVGILKKTKLHQARILITGGGRVAAGALEIFRTLGVQEVEPEEYLTKQFDKPVVCRLDPWHYAQRKDGKPFDWQFWLSNPTDHTSTFVPYTKVTDLFVACHFWDFRSPIFFRKEDMKAPDFSIKVIADVSCDIPGPIPTTLRATTIADPFYDYSIEQDEEVPAFSGENNVTTVTIDNLPGELPRDASEYFGKIMVNTVIPHFLGNDEEGVVKRATILRDGKLTDLYQYLQDYLEGKG
ncbi:MAG: NAD(P)-dependent oxidoreductase [Tenuifilaceae bacterium]|nr:NAD(P)-dependent oxidoreductase [Tenuifilaceae bacterium]